MVRRLTDPIALQELMTRIPQQPPFRFIDGLEYVSEEESRGSYTFPKDAFFYRGHFPNHAVTPGVILGECAAQIGVLPIGLFSLGADLPEEYTIYLTQIELEFIKPVFPGDRVIVSGKKMFFRKKTIRCYVEIQNTSGEPLSLGEISAIIS